MPKDEAKAVTAARRAGKAAESAWRAVRSAARSRLYAGLGMLLALAAAMALLFALGVPASYDTKVAFLVVAYSTVVVFALVGHLLGSSFDEVRRLSITDPLTGLHNRRYFGQRLSEETKRAQRYGHAASVLCVDIDRLKAINDDFGHSAGDGALVAVARALADNGFLAPGLKESEARDIVYALMSIDTYRILRLEQRWSGARYERWLANALYQLLVAPIEI
jgi:GGDEF domain-containing protein